MKTLKYLIILLVLFSCQDNETEKTISGNVFNLAENVPYADKKIVLRQYDCNLESNSKIIATTTTNQNGDFNLSYIKKPCYTYSVSVDNSNDNLLVSSNYPELKPGIENVHLL